MGGDKAVVPLCGRPLIEHAVAALSAVLADVAVQAKPDTVLPPLAGIPVWREPAEPSHPLFGLVRALDQAAGRAVLICAADLPLVRPESLARLSRSPGRLAVLATAPGAGPQPLLGRYEASSRPMLEELLAGDPAGTLRAAVASLEPELVELPAAELLNVNRPQDLEAATALLAGRERPGGAI
jgi:molybdopterin-guanine dinucleotide biosynthesis protein A